MKYIQCPHCQNKYAASDRLCAAAGKKIHCKHCQHVFEIIIHDDQIPTNQEPIPTTPAGETTTVHSEIDHAAPSVDDSHPRNKTTEPEERSDHNKNSDINTDPVKKKFNFQLFISIVLGSVLLITATVAYLFFYQHELFQPAQKQNAKQLVSHELIKPVSITFPKHKKTMSSEKPQTKKVQPASHTQKPKSLLDGPNKPSQVCKDSSADYWFRTRLLVTSQLDTATYMELLKQNMDQVKEIRRECKDKSLIARITESAKKGQKPAWINTEITSRNKAMYSPKETPQKRP